jgi:hypothetical protein
MDRIKEFIAILSDKNVQARTSGAKHNQTCKICKRPADQFISKSSEFEYMISGICEQCQTYYYGRGH